MNPLPPSRFWVWLGLALALLAPSRSAAQPSGGPYGPLAQDYAVPTDARTVYFVAPDGQEQADGLALDRPTTLAAAISRVVTGDAIILRGGVYRTGSLQLNQGITLQPYRTEQVVIKGTEVATDWVAIRQGLWRIKWSTLFPKGPESWWRRERESMRTPLHKFNNDMVFVDGRPLKSVGWPGELDADSFYIDYEMGYVYIKQDPKDKLIEITAHDGGLTRVMGTVHGKASDRRGYVMRGLTFTQFAYRALEVEGTEPEGPADESKFGKDVVGTTLEHVTLTHCSRVAGYFRGDRFVMRNCLVSDTSTEGVYLLASSDSLLERNVIKRNNVEEITGYYPSAVKIFNQTHRVVCRDNLIIDHPHSNGLWYDVGNVDGVFINNWVEGVGEAGFFYEISRDVLVAGNVFVNCENGVRILNSAGARIYHNTFLNATPLLDRTERSAVGDHFGWHPATGPDVDKRERQVFVGNLVVADAVHPLPLFRIEQSEKLLGKLTRTPMQRMDHNLFVRPPGSSQPVFVWGPFPNEKGLAKWMNWGEIYQAMPEVIGGSRLVPLEPRDVFQSPELRQLRLRSAHQVKVPIVDEVVKVLDWPREKEFLPGAYQTLAP